MRRNAEEHGGTWRSGKGCSSKSGMFLQGLSSFFDSSVLKIRQMCLLSELPEPSDRKTCLSYFKI
jgi:hypothetical protein